MEEEAAAALYDELQHKGSGAARFKHGLGFGPAAQALPQPQPQPKPHSFVASPPRRRRSRSRSGERARHRRDERRSPPARRRSRSRERRRRTPERHDDRYERHRDGRYTDRGGERRHARDHREYSRDGDRDQYRSRGRRSRSRERRRRSRSRSGGRSGGSARQVAPTDWDALIPGYADLSAGDKVKARLKHQLERVHASDHGRPADRGGSDGRAPPMRRRESAEEVAAMDRYANARQGWERYQFDNGKPLEEEDPLAVGLKPDDALAQQLAGRRGAVAVAMKNSKHDDAIFGSSANVAPAARGGGDRARRERARAAAARQAEAKAAAAAAAVGTDPLRTVLRGLRDGSDDDDDDDAPTVANADELSALLADPGAVVVAAADEATVVPVAVAAVSVDKPIAKASWREKAAQARLARMN